MTDILDEARDVLRAHGEEIGREILREIVKVSPADVLAWLRAMREKRIHKAADQAVDAIDAEVRRRQGEGHQ